MSSHLRRLSSPRFEDCKLLLTAAVVPAETIRCSPRLEFQSPRRIKAQLILGQATNEVSTAIGELAGHHNKLTRHASTHGPRTLSVGVVRVSSRLTASRTPILLSRIESRVHTHRCYTSRRACRTRRVTVSQWPMITDSFGFRDRTAAMGRGCVLL